MRLYLKCLLVAIRTTTKATISICLSLLEGTNTLRSWISLSLFPLFFCFFLSFLLSIIPYFFISSLSLSLYFIALIIFFSATLTFPFSLLSFRFHTHTLSSSFSPFAKRVFTLFPYPTCIVWYIFITVKLTISFNAFH